VPGHVDGSLKPARGDDAPLFHPAYFASLAEAPDAGLLRSLGWQAINGLNDERPTTWADRAPAAAAVRSPSVIDAAYGRHRVPAFRDRLGLPFERMIALCNATQRDPWLPVPHTAADDLVVGLARLVARTLDPGRRVRIEHPNEQRNAASPDLPQRRQAEAAAAAHFGLAPGWATACSR